MMSLYNGLETPNSTKMSGKNSVEGRMVVIMEKEVGEEHEVEHWHLSLKLVSNVKHWNKPE